MLQCSNILCEWFVFLQYAVPGYRCVPLLQALNGYQLEKDDEEEEEDGQHERQQEEQEGGETNDRLEEKEVEESSSASCQAGEQADTLQL